jgi:hypothetical protein
MSVVAHCACREHRKRARCARREHRKQWRKYPLCLLAKK